MFDNLSRSQEEWLKSTTWICLLLINATVLLRGCVFPDSGKARVEAIQNSLGWQYAPYAAVLQNYALQHADLAPILSSMDSCIREDLKSHLSPEHPRINGNEVATSFRNCMLNEIVNDMQSSKPENHKLGETLSGVTAPLANAIAATHPK
jgi:hypothetical protein